MWAVISLSDISFDFRFIIASVHGRSGVGGTWDLFIKIIIQKG